MVAVTFGDPVLREMSEGASLDLVARVISVDEEGAHLLAPEPALRLTPQLSPMPSSSVVPPGCTDLAIWSGLSALIHQHRAHDVHIVPPRVVVEIVALFDAGHDSPLAFLTLPLGVSVFLPLLHQGHWTLVVLDVGPSAVQVVICDGLPGRNQAQALRLSAFVCALCGRPLGQVVQCTAWLQSDDTSCGSILLANAAALVSGQATEAQLASAEVFLRSFPPQPSALVGTGGLSEVQTTELHGILVEHGVPADQAEERIRGAVAKLGAGVLSNALNQRNPWQALKVAASKPNAQFKWVQPSELQAHIERRAQTKFGVTVTGAKSKKRRQPDRKPTTAPLNIDPASLMLCPGSFVAEDGSPLGQLALHEVQSQATGVCFCSLAQAAPFLADPRRLSVDALALLITSTILPEAADAATLSSVRFPAIYHPTQEAVLVSGSLLQLGDVEVSLASADIAEVEPMSTTICRLNLHKDETKIPWEEVASAPVRALLSHFKELQVCKEAACGQACCCFHAPVDEAVDHLFLDVWARSFCKTGGSRVQPSDADLFQAFVRVPASAVAHLLHCSQPGFYVEPRASDGSGPHAAWTVVWLPGHTRQQAIHCLRTTPKAVALARLGAKYGIRARDADEADVFRAVRPQHQFIKVRVTTRFRLHPLPFGFQRASLVVLLGKWNWAAKPLQPDRGDSVGSAWLVGAACDPPSQALPLGDTYVLITPVKSNAHPKASAPPPVLASAKTRRRILLDDDGPSQATVDPWTEGADPWAQARSLPLPPKQESTATKGAQTKLKELEHRISTNLEDLVKQQVAERVPPPGLSLPDPRLQQLEVSLTEVQQQNSKFEEWFQTFGARVSGQAQQLEQLQTTVQEQRQEIAKVRSEVRDTVKHEVGGMQQAMAQQMSSQFASQLEHIQAMLADKKPRHA